MVSGDGFHEWSFGFPHNPTRKPNWINLRMCKLPNWDHNSSLPTLGSREVGQRQSIKTKRKIFSSSRHHARQSHFSSRLTATTNNHTFPGSNLRESWSKWYSFSSCAGESLFWIQILEWLLFERQKNTLVWKNCVWNWLWIEKCLVVSSFTRTGCRSRQRIKNRVEASSEFYIKSGSNPRVLERALPPFFLISVTQKLSFILTTSKKEINPAESFIFPAKPCLPMKKPDCLLHTM